ncbi:hypothetical protein F4009_15495 [Candidatus Poribacteria bacterium]|nr:hypothetical protein [Candidatus Poribacteria bacterium]MYH79596.1 hypothetical protein [Candidatus Poribacteria bacterium]MYK95376.1 hypothetical protein [Candidatus Poribacteria bacterium]
MFLRKYWIPISVFIVAIAGVGLYLLATQPPKDQILIIKPVEPLPKPPVAEAPVGDTSQGENVHADGTWHAEPHDKSQPPTKVEMRGNPHPSDVFVKEAPEIRYNGKLFHELTPKERAKIWEKAYRENVKDAPPPPGYLKAAEAEFQRILRSLDEPQVEITFVTGFAPNRVQLSTYLDLQAKLRVAESTGATLEANTLRAEIESLQAAARGKVPLVTGSYQSEKGKRKIRQAMKEKEEQAYRDLGLGHMVEADISGLTQVRPTRPH